MRFLILAPLIEADISPKGRKIFWNDALEIYSREIKRIVSVETLLSYQDCEDLGSIEFVMSCY